MVGNTTVVQAYYNGRNARPRRHHLRPGHGAVTVDLVSAHRSAPPAPQYAPVQTLIDGYANDPAYQALINQPVGYAQIDLLRDYNGDNMMGDFVDDAIYGASNGDADPANDVDMFFNNAGGIRTDWCDQETPAPGMLGVDAAPAADCSKEGIWSHDPMLLTYGHMFTDPALRQRHRRRHHDRRADLRAAQPVGRPCSRAPSSRRASASSSSATPMPCPAGAALGLGRV